MYKKSRNIKVLLRLQTVILVCLFSTSAYCLQSSNATVGFESAVLLVDTHTTYSGIRVRQAIYYFDLELPNDVGKSLQKVIIQQRSGQEIRFKLDKTQAYLGNHNDKQEQLKITTSQDESTGKITVIFDRPVISSTDKQLN